MVGGCAQAATLGRTNEGHGLSGSGLGRGTLRVEADTQAVGLHDVIYRTEGPKGDAQRVPVLGAGECRLERYAHRHGESRFVCVL